MAKKYLPTFITLFIFLKIFNFALYSQETITQIDSLLNEAYKLIDSDPEEAISIFKKVDELSPDNVTIKKQLGYLFLNKNDFENSLQYFKSADNLFPSDTIKLQIAYILNNLNRNTEALEYFNILKDSHDLEIKNKASSAIIILESNQPIQKFPWWGEIYTSPYYDSRFKTIFNFLQLKEGYYLTRNKFVSLLGTFQLTSDTKSKGNGAGQVPIIFSDNAAVLGAGFLFNPTTGLNLIFQTGIGIDLIKVAGKFKIKPDHRAIISYGTGIYPEISVPSKPNFVIKPLLELYSSFGYYSRYKNSIGYGTLRAGFRFFELRKTAIDLYLRFNSAIDTEKEYYNNIIELGSGIKIIPNHTWGLNILVEYNRGNYIYKPKITSIRKNYNSFRLYLIFGKLL